MATKLEHVNITVSDPERTAALLVDLFDWTIRWKGPSDVGGHTVHVGDPELGENYMAIYTTDEPPAQAADPLARGGMSHVGIVVDDLAEIERRLAGAGIEPHAHYDYEPGRRFYFFDHDGIEFEVISYAS